MRGENIFSSGESQKEEEKGVEWEERKIRENKLRKFRRNIF